MMGNRWVRGALVLFLLTVSIPACDSKPKRYACHKVSGQVLYNGQPLAGATITFFPLDEKLTRARPLAETDSQGNFELSTYLAKDGAPAGDYRVGVMLTEMTSPDPGENRDNFKPLIPVKYQKPETSGLTATVAEGTNQIQPFRLEGPPLPNQRGAASR